jgi:hypothetical protein
MRCRVGDKLIELPGLDHAAGHQRRDALDRGEEDEAYALRLAGFEGALGLALFRCTWRSPRSPLGSSGAFPREPW